MNSPRTSLEAVLQGLAAEPVAWSRLAAIADDEGAWSVRLMEVTTGPEPPPGWERRSWRYQLACFEGTVDTGDALAAGLEAGRLVVGEREVVLPTLVDSVTWERRQSRSTAPYETLDWPVTEATLSSSSTSAGEPWGHLVSDEEAPSFVNFYSAAACFFWLDRQPSGGALHQGLMLRHQDGRGRINSVRIAGDEVQVQVEGSAIDGMTVELAGDVPGHTQRVWDRSRAGAAEVRFAIEDGVPSGAWVLIRRGAEWIDRRFLSVPWTGGREAGVEVVVEPRTRLEAFLADREGPEVEFKRQIPVEDNAKHSAMKTVCAFANGRGGSLLFGIDDDHNVVGLAARAVERAKDQLTQMVGSWVHPRPSVSFTEMPAATADHVVLELAVAPGTSLYGCGARGEEVRTAFIRHHATTVRARPDEIEQIVHSRDPARGRSGSWRLS